MATAAEPIEQVKERIDLIANTKAREEVEAGAKLIDVREPHEWDEAHLEGAIHVPQGELLDRIDEVAPDHSERIVLYCRTDNRSTRAADALRDLVNGAHRFVSAKVRRRSVGASRVGPARKPRTR